MSEFSDRPFVAGSLTGLRSFRVDALGRLTGVACREVFRPGENVARCERSHLPAMWIQSYFPTMRPVSEEPRAEMPPPPHQVASRDCSCGFYAYFDGVDNPHHERGNVQAVIQGYGVTMVGSRGFRSEKARLLALIEPERQRGAPLDGVARRIDDGFPWFMAGVIGLTATLAWGLTAVLSNPWYGFVFALLPVALLLCYLGIRAESGGLSGPSSTPRMDVVRRLYPDVPVYRSVWGALRDFPLTPPEPATPETDPDFWTRAS